MADGRVTKSEPLPADNSASDPDCAPYEPNDGLISETEVPASLVTHTCPQSRANPEGESNSTALDAAGAISIGMTLRQVATVTLHLSRAAKLLFRRRRPTVGVVASYVVNLVGPRCPDDGVRVAPANVAGGGVTQACIPSPTGIASR